MTDDEADAERNNAKNGSSRYDATGHRSSNVTNLQDWRARADRRERSSASNRNASGTEIDVPTVSRVDGPGPDQGAGEFHEVHLFRFRIWRSDRGFPASYRGALPSTVSGRTRAFTLVGVSAALGGMGVGGLVLRSLGLT